MTHHRPISDQLWRSVRLVVRLFRDPDGNPRKSAKDWSPKNGHAGIHRDSTKQQTQVLIESANRDRSADVRFTCGSDRLALYRNQNEGWREVSVGDGHVEVEAGKFRVRITDDGALSVTTQTATTYIEADGAILKLAGDDRFTISADGAEMYSKTPERIAAIKPDGVLCKDKV